MSSVFSERHYTGRTEEQEAGSFEGLLGVRGQSGFRLPVGKLLEPCLGRGLALYVRILSWRWTWMLEHMSTVNVVIRKSSLFFTALCSMWDVSFPTRD